LINPGERKVTRAGKDINLRRKEFDILEYLVINNGRVLTRKMILDHVWEADTTSWTGTIDVHIKHLRDKVDRPFNSALIKTTYGIGYKVDIPD
jgi:DNA-binding response OmpR family regulator